jgi:aerobic carbon-monoxide dehydrogenase large subunit
VPAAAAMSTTWCCRGMAFGHVLRSPHAHARHPEHRHAGGLRCRACCGAHRPGLDRAVGLGRPAGADGALQAPRRRPMYRPRLSGAGQGPRAHVGDYVAFVVAETLETRPRRRRADRGRLTSRCPRGVGAPRSAGRAAGLGRLPQQHLFLRGRRQGGDRSRLRQRADRVVKHRFVINRVTANTMEPRGSIGVYDAGTGRYTLYCDLPARPGFRNELAATRSRCRRADLRLIAGDIGGSFGMKRLGLSTRGAVLLGLQARRPAGEMDRDPLEALPQRRAGARQRHRGRACARRDGTFLAVRVQLRQPRRLSAFPAPAPVINIGTVVRRLPHAGRLRRHLRRVDQHHCRAALPRQRAAGGVLVIERLVDLAADEMQIDPAELRRRNYIPPRPCPTRQR